MFWTNTTITAENLKVDPLVSCVARRGKTYAAVAVNISTRELVDEMSTRPNAKTVLNRAMSPRIIPILCTLERTTIATMGSRQATIVVKMDVTRTIQLFE